MGADAALALLVLLALPSVTAFAPSFPRGLPDRHMRVAAPRAKTCAPDRVRLISCAVSPLHGTGASYTEIVAETDDDDEDDNEEGEGEQGEGGDGAIEGEVKKTKKQKKKKSGTDKQKVKLEPEVTFFEGGPDVSEVVAPAVSILTVIGIVPFSAALARQAWVKYTITSRRIKVVSGWQGKDTTEVVYPDIVDMRFVWRSFGRCGDLVMTLRDGSKLEIRSLPEFERNYNYILERTSPVCKTNSQKIKPFN